MAVNPGTPMAVTLPGPAVRALAASLDQASIDPWPLVDPGPGWWTGDGAPELLELQVAVPPSALTHYLRGGYDRVAGIVHLRPPRRVDIGSLYLHLGLARPGSPFALTDETLHIVRWRPDDGAAREWRAAPAPRLASARVPAGTSLIRVALDGTERVVAYFDGRHWGSVP